MKFRLFFAAVTLCLTSVAAHAQAGVYLNPIAIRVSNSIADTGPYAFLGQNATSNVFYGFDLGGYYDFFQSGNLATGIDLRGADLHANNASLRSFLLGIRLTDKLPGSRFRPYLQGSVGVASTKPPTAAIHITKFEYQVYGGLDYAISRHVDIRTIEVGYGSGTTISSANIGGGGTVAIPASKMLSFSSGLVFRFP